MLNKDVKEESSQKTLLREGRLREKIEKGREGSENDIRDDERITGSPEKICGIKSAR